MNLAAALLLGHLIADFPLQTSWIYRYKTESWLGVVLHATIHVLVTALLIRPVYATAPLLILLGILHFITDYTKLHVPAKRQSPGFLIDQFVHLLILLLLAELWQSTLYAVLPAALLLPLIVYGMFLGLLVFLWVLACDLAKGDWGRYALVQWSQRNLLKLSNYAGLALFIFLAQQWHHNAQASSHKLIQE